MQILVMKFTTITLQLRPGKSFTQLGSPHNSCHNQTHSHDNNQIIHGIGSDGITDREAETNREENDKERSNGVGDVAKLSKRESPLRKNAAASEQEGSLR